jgi:hypothetical protein
MLSKIKKYPKELFESINIGALLPILGKLLIGPTEEDLENIFAAVWSIAMDKKINGELLSKAVIPIADAVNNINNEDRSKLSSIATQIIQWVDKFEEPTELPLDKAAGDPISAIYNKKSGKGFIHNVKLYARLFSLIPNDLLAMGLWYMHELKFRKIVSLDLTNRTLNNLPLTASKLSDKDWDDLADYITSML